MAAWLSAISLIVVAITLLANSVQAREVARQTRILSKTNRALLAHSVNKEMQHLSRLLVERPELRPYIYGNTPTPEHEPERSQVLTIAEMFVDLMWHTIQGEAFFREEERAGWHRYFHELASGSTAIQDFWLVGREWYDPLVWQLIDEPIQTALSSRTGAKAVTPGLPG